jgi:hypothetical protein
MTELKTNYKDDVLDTSKNALRQYNMTNNANGTVSLQDVTEYLVDGDNFGAEDINKTNAAVNELNSNLTTSDGVTFRFGVDADGNYGYITTGEDGADSVHPFSEGDNKYLRYDEESECIQALDENGNWVNIITMPPPFPVKSLPFSFMNDESYWSGYTSFSAGSQVYFYWSTVSVPTITLTIPRKFVYKRGLYLSINAIQKQTYQYDEKSTAKIGVFINSKLVGSKTGTAASASTASIDSSFSLDDYLNTDLEVTIKYNDSANGRGNDLTVYKATIS